MNVWIQNPFDNLRVEGYRKQRYWLMAEAFVAAGHEVVYWTSDFSHATKAKRRVSGSEGRPIDLRLVPTRPYRKNVSLARILSHRGYARAWEREALRLTACSRPLARPDLIVSSMPPLSTGEVARRLADHFGAKLVVDVQDAWPETFYRLLPTGFGWLGKILLAPLHRAARRAYRAADLVTGVCDRYEALAKGYGAKRYLRAYLGVELSSGALRPASAARPQDALRLAYVGNMGRGYDLETVVEGVRRLNAKGVKATLDVAGFGRTIAEESGVRFHGLLDAEAMRELLAGCDLGVIPMAADSFVGLPNKLADYAAAGLRVVSSLAGETERILAAYDAGRTYLAGDAESFVRAVEAAAKLPRENALKLAREELDAAVIYRKYVEEVCRSVK